MTTIGLYRPGTSVLHRLPAGWKLFAMFAGIIGLVALHRPWEIGVAAAIVAAVYVRAGIPARVVLRQLWPLRWLLLIVAVLQVVLSGWQAAVVVCGGLLISMAIATLVTLTTRVTEILDVCQRLLRPFTRWGLDADRVGLVLAMTIRCIPLVAGIVDEVSQARKARGLGFSVVALVVPVVVRALRSADAMGDALIARGIDD
ncbi:energy-coupling factor transporter transmembrane protein EcfT [Nakamurella sp. PAMC28650]|uniref:energy-coupling factor transporter transmembrane component T family protein n=1 Tax=Nakamurella sp. PAMC28650 TaxID=2762325 RepID=UPI00164D072E|nr:energy-coupling factor transporter transmembrane protein EcfT [Nakamurella sp. PAMC28650]QNK81116.1 energy-coupling factor transporter transmembrane protein EcfT [Nakamurella sp. PAMC28650]